jgi:hypothetical protein
MLEDGWTKGDFNKDGIGNVAYVFKFTSLFLFLLMIHDVFFFLYETDSEAEEQFRVLLLDCACFPALQVRQKLK